jgi:hypothetical protein
MNLKCRAGGGGGGTSRVRRREQKGRGERRGEQKRRASAFELARVPIRVWQEMQCGTIEDFHAGLSGRVGEDPDSLSCPSRVALLIYNL